MDTCRLLVKPFNCREHKEVLLEIDWGNLPPNVIKAIGTWLPIKHAGIRLSHMKSGELPERFRVEIGRMMEEAAAERGLSTPTSDTSDTSDVVEVGYVWRDHEEESHEF